MYRAAVAAAMPAACLPQHWPRRPAGRLAVIAAGKAALGMAEAASQHYSGEYQGLLVHPAVTDGPPPVVAGFDTHAASHPVPDAASVTAGRAALRLAARLQPEDLLLVLLSGGASSMLCVPASGLLLAEKQALFRQLLACGAPIGEINCVRKHLSRIKGGRLAGASAARVVTLAISDVAGDDPAVIASGPTVPDPSTLADARAVLERYGMAASPAVSAALDDRANETPKSGRERDEYRVVANGATALAAAAGYCHRLGWEVLVLGDRIEAGATALARHHADLAMRQLPRAVPVCLLSGGETSVRIEKGCGAGGRNTEYALALAIALRQAPGIWALAADTDGIDGFGGHTGALVDPGTLERARQSGLDAGDYLDRHDSAGFFAAVGGLLSDGPSGTNVNDFRAILIEPRGH